MIGLMQTVTFDGYEQLMGALMLSYSSSSYIFFVLAIVLLGTCARLGWPLTSASMLVVRGLVAPFYVRIRRRPQSC